MSTTSAEPKGPPPVDEAGSTKKSSKKSSSKRAVDGGFSSSTPTPAASLLSSVAAPTAPTSPVPTLHDMPRLAIADPKGPTTVGDAGSDGGERKARASKKRVSTPESETGTTGHGPSLPPTVSAQPAAKSDADGEKERAKREAKKQRQREIDEQRKREELERQAVEEARKKEEIRLRELRRQQEQSALNANADVVQEEEDDGYRDEGFEDYGDDFENDEESTTASSKVPTQAKPAAKAKGVTRDMHAPVLDSSELKRIQEAQKAESKELASSSRPLSKASSTSAGGNQITQDTARPEAKIASSPATSIAASIAGLKQSLDPRARRAKEIRDSRRFDVEKFNVFVQAPMAEVDIYLARLRRGNVRQVGVQTKEDDKCVSTQTKVAELVDRSMHFPDDVGIDDVAKKVSVRNNRRGQDNQANNDINSPEGEENAEDEDEVSTMSSMRFMGFLEQSAQVCEQLIEENIQEREYKKLASETHGAPTAELSQSSTFSHAQLFPSKYFDNYGIESLLRGRTLTDLQFSSAVSNIFVTWYSLSPSKLANEHKEDESSLSSVSEKSVGVVWDTNQLHHALYVLRSEDMVTTVSLGPTRDLFVLAGTEDGAVNVWDLRSRLALVGRRHSSQYALDLYSPTYSTSGADSRSVEGSHQSPIVAIDIIEWRDGSSFASGMFQFGSLDNRGMLLIWSMIDYSSSPNADTMLSDKCAEVGGRIKLVVSVAIDTQLQYLVMTRPTLRAHARADPHYLDHLSGNLQGAATSRIGGFGNSSSKKTAEDVLATELCVGPIATVFKFFPNEPNEFLVGTTTGIVMRGNRFSRGTATESTTPTPVDCYRRDRHSLVTAPTPLGIAVTAIAFHPLEHNYFLVGYEDGRICLFDARLTAAVATWEEVDFDKSVASLQWSPSRPGIFFASYSHGLVHAWDLIARRHAPAFEYKLPARHKTSLAAFPIALSSEKIRTSRPCITVASGDAEPFEFQVHELGTEFTTSTPSERQALQQTLASIF